MAKTFQLEIITPTQVFDEGQVEYVRAPGRDGLFGVKAGHTKSIMALATGEIKVVKDGVDRVYACSGGYAEITGEKAQLLVEAAELKENIDVTRAQEAYDRARQRLEAKREEMIDEEKAFKAMERALNRLKVAKK